MTSLLFGISIMLRRAMAAFIVIAAAVLPIVAASQPIALSFSLTYLDRYKIRDDAAGLKEPSGLVLSRKGDALWTVSDNKKRLFKLSLEGELLSDQSFMVDDEDLEGVTIDPATGALLVVKEGSNEILKVDVASKRVVSRHLVAEMAGFSAIGRYFSNGNDNKGFEGITFNPHTDSFFVLKEREPGLIIEISKDLSSILNAHGLDATNGFIDDEIDDALLDFSGIQYDDMRSLFWIVSDQAKRLFLYDFDQDKVIQSASLGYAKDGEFHEIKTAEGVTIDSKAHRLYVVSDQEARLYVFDLR